MNIKESDLTNIDKTGIYIISNMINNKHYVGQAIQKYGFNGRWRQRYNKHLTNAFIKYGKDNFEYSIIEVIEQNDLDLETFKNIVSFWETYWILYYDCINHGYNKCRYKCSTKGADFYKTKDWSNKMSRCHKGITSGKNNGMWGRKHSEKTKQKMSDINKKRCSDINYRKRMSECQKGIHVGKNNPSAKVIVQLTLDNRLVREYDYIKLVEKYQFNYCNVSKCINHKYFTILGNNIYGKKNEEKYIWLSKEEYNNRKVANNL